MFGVFCSVWGLLGVALPLAATEHPGQAQLVTEVAADTGKDPAGLNRLLSAAQRRQSILDAISRPAEGKPWSRYRPIFLTPKRIHDGVVFYRQHRRLLEDLGQRYGVDPAYVVAILGVETAYGANTGSYKVLDALVTLGLYYPPRAVFFRSQLKTLLELPPNQLAGPLDQLTGSYAGAQGWGQFMPDSIRQYGVDADGDGRIDLLHSIPDIVASVANYLHGHGWQPGQPVVVPALAQSGATALQAKDARPRWSVQQLEAWGYAPTRAVDPAAMATVVHLAGEPEASCWLGFQNFYVITTYNRSPLYAMAVHQLAMAIQAGSTALDQAQ
ncbi:lytic murein transglycosylase B [Frateuria aurantia]